MRKIMFVSAAILFMSFLTMFQLIELTIANPVGMYGPKPSYALVSIENPLYSSELSFTIKTNSFWQTGSNYSDSHCLVILDSSTYEFKELSHAEQNTITDDYAYDPYTEYTLKGTTPIANFTNLASGTYNVEVKYGYYRQLAFPNRNMEFVALGSATSQIILTQDITQRSTSSPSTPSISLSPTQSPKSSSTITPTMTNTQISSNYAPNPIILISTAIVVVIVAVASVALIYFKRHRQRQNNIMKGLLT
jgi:hypothetical protein